MEVTNENAEQNSPDVQVEETAQAEPTGDMFVDNLGLVAKDEEPAPVAEPVATEEPTAEPVEEPAAEEPAVQTTEDQPEAEPAPAQEVVAEEAEENIEEPTEPGTVLSNTKDALELLDDKAQESVGMSYDNFRDMQSIDYTSVDKTEAILEYKLTQLDPNLVENMSEEDIDQMREGLDHQYRFANMSREDIDKYKEENDLTESQVQDKIMSAKADFLNSHLEAVSNLNEMQSELGSRFNASEEEDYEIIADEQPESEVEAETPQFDPEAHKKEFDEYFKDYNDEVSVNGESYSVNFDDEQKDKIEGIMASQNFWQAIGATKEDGAIDPSKAFNVIARTLFPEKYTGIGITQGQEQGQADMVKKLDNIDFTGDAKNQKVTDTEKSISDQFIEDYRNVK